MPIAILLFLLIQTSIIPLQAFPEPQLPDGIYLVLDVYEEAPTGVAVGQVISYSHEFLDDAVGEPSFLCVFPVDFVPLELARAPEGKVQDDKRIHLLLTLESASARRLEEFTTAYVNRQVAMVIGGKAVTLHKVRTPITGGQLQITRCTDNACEKLLVALKDNVVKE